MRLKLKEAMTCIDYDELVSLHEDLREGAHSTMRLVGELIAAKEKEMGRHCHVCQSEIDPNGMNNYTVLLGPEGLRRKADFCALDCLKFFIASVEKRKKGIQANAYRSSEACAGGENE